MAYQFRLRQEPFDFSYEFDDYENGLLESDAEVADFEEEEEIRLRPRVAGPVSRGRPPPRRPRPPRTIIRPWRGSAVVIHEPSPCTCPEQTCPQHGSEYIRWVQSTLNRILGMRMPLNGVLTPATRSAIRSFQEREKLPVTGIVGPDTERELIAARGGQSAGAGAMKPVEPGMMEPPEPAATPEPGMTEPSEPATPPAAGEFDFEWEFFNDEFESPQRGRYRNFRWLQKGGSSGSTTTPPLATTPQPIDIDAANCVDRVRAADAAIKSRFGLTGAALIEASTNRVRCVPESRFEMFIPASAIRDILVNAFMEQSEGHPFNRILRHHNKALVITDDEKHTAARMRRLREFVEERIKVGHFQFITVEATVGPNARLAAITNTMPFRRVAAAAVGGFTTSQAVRASRRVTLPLPNIMETLVHEGCHFYAHNNFSVVARGNNEFFKELRVSQILLEGFCEFFARDVMRANQATFGPTVLGAYERHVEFTGRIIDTAGGDAVARNAYFAGNAAAINRVLDSVRRNRTAYPLMVP